ncbi:hypothetical protein AZE42_06573 [Rhizopogon vesiculosus]|uniref:Amine oxidase domain-containing protein n=1 Tax=Rhizopogon vesiculosus TaxID=180088 RepID=A0A1J8QD69_9AGAM|nr:hypothetical protein AZE42_06573 [Rhizopogon vesiculosus]
MGVDECSFTARYARQLVRENIARELDAFNDPVGTDEHPLEEGTLDKCLPLDVTFCIIGAGAAGLYTAMILKELGIPFDILEASDRVGGRMYTHRFSEAPNDYYDVGAMRSNRAFSLFEELHIPLIPYYINGKNTPMMFNNILGPPVDPLEFDPYKFSAKNGSMVPDEHVAMGVQKILQQACAPYFQLLKENFEEGFKKLMEVDDCSIREYMRTHMQLDYYTIQWMETSTAYGVLQFLGDLY